MSRIINCTTGEGEMTERTGRKRHVIGVQQSTGGWLRFLALLLVVIQVTACSKQSDTPKQPAKPPEPKNQTYRMIGGHSVISLVSSDELEIREGGQNIVCKYTKQDGKLRVVVSALGTTTAKYFNMTPQGLVDEDGDIYYEPATYEKVMAQIELNRQLWAAVENDNATAIDELIRKGAAVETRNEAFTPLGGRVTRTALVMAIEEGKTNAVAALLQHKANPNQSVGDNGETAIWRAIANGNITATELLIKHGALTSGKRNDGATPHMLAASIGGGWMGPQRKPEHDRLVSILCETKPDLNAQDNDGYSALGWSLRTGNLEAAKILVAAGADRNTGKDTGHDAFTLAKNDKKKIDAIRTPAEREAREKLFGQYPTLLVGVWRDENSVMTYNADGTRITKHDEKSRPEKGTWSVKEDVLQTENYRATIIELTESTFVFEDSGGRWHAKRVSNEEVEAARQKMEKTRQMFIGTWRNDDGQFTFNADGTLIGNNSVTSGKWSIDGDIFTSGSGREYKIIEISDTSFFLKYTGSWGSDFRGTKVTKALLEAERAQQQAALAKVESARRLLVGTWRGEDGIFTYNSNGSLLIRSGNGQTQQGSWSIEGDVLHFGRNDYRIIHINETTYELDDNGRRYRGTRLK